MRRAIALATCAIAACSSSPAPVTSCADSLAGIWHGPDGDYHALDMGRHIELHPLFDSAHPGSGRSAWMFGLKRGDALPTGSVSFWLTRDARTCRIRWPAQLRRCADDALTLAYQSGPIACDAAPRDGWVELLLRR